MPAAHYYAEKNLTPEEAGILNEEEAQKRTREADAAIRHRAQGNIAEVTSFTQLHPKDVSEYLDYSKSTAALHDFFVSQTGIRMPNMIPNSTFIKSLKRIDLVDFKNDRETLIKNWIDDPIIRADFEIFFRFFLDRALHSISKRYSTPDHPPMNYF